MLEATSDIVGADGVAGGPEAVTVKVAEGEVDHPY